MSDQKKQKPTEISGSQDLPEDHPMKSLFEKEESQQKEISKKNLKSLDMDKYKKIIDKKEKRNS